MGKGTMEKRLTGVRGELNIWGWGLFKAGRKVKSKCPDAEKHGSTYGFSNIAVIGNLGKSNYGRLVGES